MNQIIKEAGDLVVGDGIVEKEGFTWIVFNIKRVTDKTIEFTLKSSLARIMEHRLTGEGLKRIYRNTQHFLIEI